MLFSTTHITIKTCIAAYESLTGQRPTSLMTYSNLHVDLLFMMSPVHLHVKHTTVNLGLGLSDVQ